MKPIKLIVAFTVLISIGKNAFAQNIPIPTYRPIPKSAITKTGKALDTIETILYKNNTYNKMTLINNLNFFDVFANEQKYDSAKIVASKTLDDYSTLKNRKQQLTGLISSLKKTKVSDSAMLATLNERITDLKTYNTYEFLTSEKPSKPFRITYLRQYNLDSFNAWLYNQSNVDVFQSAAIQNFANSKALISTELASFLFGPVRMGVGGSFTTKGDTTQDEAVKTSLQKMLTSGGTVNLNFLLPLFLARTRHDHAHFSIFAAFNNSINPGIDSTGKADASKEVWYTNQSGVNIHADFGSSDNKARISLDFPFYYSWGSQNSYQQLSITDFSVLKMQIGVVIGDLINLHVSGPLLSSSKTIKKIPFGVSLQFSPSQVAQSVKKQ